LRLRLVAAACAAGGAFRLFRAAFHAELAGVGGAAGADPGVGLRGALLGRLSGGRCAANGFQGAPQFIRLALQLTVGVGIGAVRPFVAQLKADLVKIGGVDGDNDVKPVFALIPGRVEADSFALGVLLIQFRLILLNLKLTFNDLAEGDDVGIALAPIPLAADQKALAVFVQIHLGGIAQNAGGRKIVHLLFVFFPVVQMLADLLHRGLPPVRHIRGKQPGAVFAQVTVGQLAVAQQPDFSVADVAEFLVKQSHGEPSLCYCPACIFAYRSGDVKGKPKRKNQSDEKTKMRLSQGYVIMKQVEFNGTIHNFYRTHFGLSFFKNGDCLLCEVSST